MKKCKYCQSEISEKAKICPNCNKKQAKLPLWVKAIIIIFVIAIIISACSSETDSTSNSGSSEKETTKVERFELLEDYKSDESNAYFYYIEGKIRNNKDRDYSYIQVTFTTYDKEGNTIGTCMDNQNNLKSNGTWKFKVICTDGVNEIDHYELGEITGW